MEVGDALGLDGEIAQAALKGAHAGEDERAGDDGRHLRRKLDPDRCGCCDQGAGYGAGGDVGDADVRSPATISSATPGPSRQALQQVAEAVQALSRRLPGADLSLDELRNRSWWRGPEAYVVVDDYDLVVTPAGDPLAQLLPLLPQSRDIGLHLMITHRVGGAGRALYQPLLLRLKELGSPALLLSGDPMEGVLLGGQRATPQPPGRGVLVRRRERPTLVQVALSEP